ncbi:unnamed protein product [Rhizophagus irregularis]|nr:unnamed protein product [Rhizophagus irregularis]
MNASIKNSTKALLNKLHIFPEEMTLWDGSSVTIKNEILSLWNNNNFEKENSTYFIQPISEDRCLSSIVVGGENVFEDDHV